MTLLLRILSLFHRHRWDDCLWNSYGMGVEQHCKCGAYQHHTTTNLRGFNIQWQPGRHPFRELASKAHDSYYG